MVLGCLLVLFAFPLCGVSGSTGETRSTSPAPAQERALAAFRPETVLRLSPQGANIQESVKHSPAFATLHVKLGAGAEIIAEAGAMVCMQV